MLFSLMKQLEEVDSFSSSHKYPQYLVIVMLNIYCAINQIVVYFLKIEFRFLHDNKVLLLFNQY